MPTAQRWLLAMRAKSDLLELWRTCSKKTVPEHHACHGDKLCYRRPMQADLKTPNRGRLDFVFSHHYSKELDEPFAILEHLPFNPALKPSKRKSRDAQNGRLCPAGPQLSLRI